MAIYTVTAPFKDGTGRHRPGDVLENIEHAAGLIDAGLIRAEPEPEPEPPEKKEPPAEKSEPGEEKTENTAPAQKTEKPVPSKKTGSKKK